MQDCRFNHYMNWGQQKDESKKCCEKKCKHTCKCEHKDEKCPEKDCCSKNECKGCICHQLKCLPIGTLVDVVLVGGFSLADVFFISLDPKTCCATFLEVADVGASPIIIDCQQIIVIRRSTIA
ncbi:hypothetical protein AB9L15_11445 [Lysinibacillus fusiformis]|uniref:hypothetical protein n=1 Tax=Lysinibacillus fusiformis TaxID=28031 RepID=UPI0000F3A819|nr:MULTISPECIES: hypothetical protein [Lysinibacillus]EAZ84338.1 hypothetical protein BB14905_18965 [Bacillus sp. B14905]MED4075869.1 hypothetical protein [Lysinibacillus fusiformis]MED4672420.1 hypothetical protein [Lysinibacillus fusiformis]PCD84529.1 hypothetical protein CNQ87_09190 [Lysinibacillus fusiformis]QAS55595.1 hypothetical protein LSP_03930 [Lysinibacillus sphaericus]